MTGKGVFGTRGTKGWVQTWRFAGVAMVGALAVVLPMVLTSSPSESSVSPLVLTSDQTSSLLNVAQMMASGNGDPVAATAPVLVVGCTRFQALGVVTPGDYVNGPNPDSYVIQLRGSFSGALEKVPAGLQAVPGTVLTVIVDAATYQVEDWNLNTTAPDIGTLGPSTTLNS